MIPALIPALEGLGIAFEVGVAELGAGGIAELGLAGEVADETVGQVARKVAPPVRVNVTSTAILSVTYYETSGDMIVNMHDGTAVEYYDIPLNTFLALVSAPSPGSYYNRFVRLSSAGLARG